MPNKTKICFAQTFFREAEEKHNHKQKLYQTGPKFALHKHIVLPSHLREDEQNKINALCFKVFLLC